MTSLGAVEEGLKRGEGRLGEKGNLIFLFCYNNNKDQFGPKLRVPTTKFAFFGYGKYKNIFIIKL